MARKVESIDTIFSKLLRGEAQYEELSARDLTILGLSALDISLLHLLEVRLLDVQDVAGAFLGADGNGNAPAGTFGAKVQLAILLGVLPKEMIPALKALQQIRNKFAHRFDVKLSDPSILGHLGELHKYIIFRLRFLRAPVNADDPSLLKKLGEYRKKESTAKWILELAIKSLQDDLYFYYVSVDRIPSSNLPKLDKRFSD